jgi:glycerophosphoryl diester phosphodiesterase
MGSSRDAVEAPPVDAAATGARTGWRTDVGNSFDGVPTLIAHRGFAGENPENTVSAMRTAAAVADWIEIDCRPTADGACAVFHDPVLDRCTDLSGAVAETPAETVFSAEVDGGGSIPTIEEALDVVPPDTGVVLDLKGRTAEDPDDECWKWLAEPLKTVAETPHPTLVSAFSEDALDVVEEHAPALPTAYLCKSEVDRALAIARRRGCAALHPSSTLLLDEPDAGETDLLVRAHEAGLTVHAWTVSDAEEAATLAALGVDGVIADHADVLDSVERP